MALIFMQKMIDYGKSAGIAQEVGNAMKLQESRGGRGSVIKTLSLVFYS